MDNCIEACEQIQDKPKKIEVSVLYDDNAFVCKISNSSVKPKDGFLSTNKKDKNNHGFGIENIKSALGKYNSIYRFNQSDDSFILSFVIFEEYNL